MFDHEGDESRHYERAYQPERRKNVSRIQYGKEFSRHITFLTIAVSILRTHPLVPN
jgi:hypothetical protein